MFQTPITSALASSMAAAELPRTLLISPLLSSLPTYLRVVQFKLRLKTSDFGLLSHLFGVQRYLEVLLGTETPRDLVVENVEEEGVVAQQRDLLLLHDLHGHRGEDRVELGEDDVPHDHFPRALLGPHLVPKVVGGITNLRYLLNLVVLGEVEGKCDDVLHGVPRRKEEFSNVDCRSHPS